jgi:ABC-type dipeptide/oligopeptide/nickel transport system permease component
MMGISMPTFVVGPLLVLAFAIHLGWFNASGWYTPRIGCCPRSCWASPTPPRSRG